jgi:hypothetical protein
MCEIMIQGAKDLQQQLKLCNVNIYSDFLLMHIIDRFGFIIIMCEQLFLA